jgi:ABC-type cobalamin/Fe3+-siderophores transport system ATPase subunit
MHIELKIKNYRCFPDSRPLQFEIREGFTAFVGVNNSGKSSILRFVYEFRSLFLLLTTPHHFLELLRGSTNSFALAPSVKDLREIFCDSNDRDMTIEFSFPTKTATQNAEQSSVSLRVPRDTTQFSLIGFAAGVPQYEPSKAYIYLSSHLIGAQGANFAVDFGQFNDALTGLAETLYIGAFRNAINAGSMDNYFDIAIGQSFIKQWRTYKTGNVKKHNELIKQVTRDISSIFELDLEINPTPDDENLQIFVGSNSFKLNELGAGIAQFILVLGTVAIRAPQFVLIDEPELNLHPSLQLSFLTTLASYAKNGVLFSTHSIGLARAMADRVYAVKRIKQGESEVHLLEGVPRYTEFLGELSFNGYQELGFDKIVLVEGPTEVRTIQQFLRMLKKDHKIVLLQLGGRSMINGSREQELQELTRVSKNILALIDSERAAAGEPLEKPRKAFVDICQKIGIKCCVLERRATENYLSDEAIKRVKGSGFRALGPHEKLSPPNNWGKSENWKIAGQMNLSDLKGTDLLAFLDSL